jgi:hypothetical protein
MASSGGCTSETMFDWLQLLSAVFDQSSSAILPGGSHAAEHEHWLWSHRRLRHYLLWYRGMSFDALRGIAC